MITVASYLFFATTGRIARSSWWIGIGTLIVLNILVFFVLWAVLGPNPFVSLFGRLVALCLNALNIYIIYCMSAKRFQDRNRSALNAMIVAFIWAAKAAHDLFVGDLREPDTFDLLFVFLGTGTALWYFIELGLLQGTPGPNRFGEAAAGLFARPHAD